MGWCDGVHKSIIIKQLRNRELEATLYHNLRVLLEETDRIKFEDLLSQTLKELNGSRDTVENLQEIRDLKD